MGSKNVIISSWHWACRFGSVFTVKSGLAAICLIIFSGSLTWLYHDLKYITMEDNLIERWRDDTILFGLCTVFGFELSKVDSWFEKQFLWICRFTLLGTWAIKTGTDNMLIAYPYNYLLSLDAGTLFATIVIMILAVKHNILNE